jgi:hypothetical protein
MPRRLSRGAGRSWHEEILIGVIGHSGSEIHECACCTRRLRISSFQTCERKTEWPPTTMAADAMVVTMIVIVSGVMVVVSIFSACFLGIAIPAAVGDADARPRGMRYCCWDVVVIIRMQCSPAGGFFTRRHSSHHGRCNSFIFTSY